MGKVPTQEAQMGRFNYTLRMHTPEGKVLERDYQGMLEILGVQDEIVHHAPLSAGGVPQVQSFMGLLKKAAGFTRVQAFFNGNLLLEA
jgi:hypothetical protein